MKKFMLRKKPREYLPESLEYNTWYNLVTPFDWQYFKLKKGSRIVEVYEFIDDKHPLYITSKKKFIKEILPWAKSPPTPAFKKTR